MQGLPSASRARQSSIGSASTRVERGERALHGHVAGRRVGVEERGRGVQPEVGQRVRRAGPLAEDRGVAEAVAVDLAGQRVGHRAAGRGGVRLLELAVVLVEVERAGERDRRVGAGAQRAAAGRAGS